MGVDLSIGHLILNASLVVQLVMLVLLAASITSWVMIFRKRQALKQAQTGAEDFEQQFWSGGNLSEMYTQMAQPQNDTGGLERIFRSGFREFSRMRKQGAEADGIVQASHRAMRITVSRESDGLESGLSYLATVGSTSPYIGLFGTVAPGIAEALIATALGLFAAIPAVIAYNRYASSCERIISHYEIFVEEFTSILQRHVAGSSAQRSAASQ